MQKIRKGFLLITLLSIGMIPVQANLDVFLCNFWTIQAEYWCEQGHVDKCRRYLAYAEEECGG